MLRLISATLSPYARKVRMVQHADSIAFERRTGILWHLDASARPLNPCACALGELHLRFAQNDWRTRHRNLLAGDERLALRQAFKKAISAIQTISDQIA